MVKTISLLQSDDLHYATSVEGCMARLISEEDFHCTNNFVLDFRKRRRSLGFCYSRQKDFKAIYVLLYPVVVKLVMLYTIALNYRQCTIILQITKNLELQKCTINTTNYFHLS